jgi:hypothetical protein
MTSATNRRAILGAVLAAGAGAATGATPAVAKPTNGPDDPGSRRALELWSRWQKQNDLYNAIGDEATPEEPLEEAVEKEFELLDEIEDALHSDMRASIHALAAMLMIEVGHGGLEEIVADLHFASLAAIRPQLVGAIAEAADRVLAEEEEARP